MGSSWLRGRRKWAVVAAAALVAYTLFGFFAVPWIVRGQLAKRARLVLGREASIERVRFNPFTLAIEAEGLRLADLDGTPLIALDRARLDLQVSGIFRRAFRFREVLVERPVVTLRILENGRPSVADLFEPDPDSREPFRIQRVIVDRLAIGGGRVEFFDRSRSPAFESRFEPFDLEVLDLATLAEESGEHSITIGFGDAAELRWQGAQTIEPLRLTGRFDVTGLELAKVWEYFGHGQPIEIREGRADLTLPYRVERDAQGAIVLALAGATLGVRGLVVGPRDGSDEWLELPELQVRAIDAAWPAARVEVGEVSLSRPRVLVRADEQGAVNWNWSSGSEPPSGGAPALQVHVAAVEISDGAVRLEDLASEPDVAVDVSGIALRLENVSSDPAAAIAFRASARVGESGTAGASGSIVREPLAAEADVDVAALDLLPFSSYFMPPGMVLAAGNASVQGRATVAGPTPTITFDGTASVDGVDVLDPDGVRLLGWTRMGFDGVRLEHPPTSARIETVVLDSAFAKVHIDQDGNLNLMTLEASAAPAPTSEPLPAVEVGTVEIRAAAVDFKDDTLILPFAAKIHSAAGSIHDLSTFAAAPATIAVEGRVDEIGYVKIDGTIRLADPFASTDVQVDFRSLEMPRLTPYSAEFAGYAIASGLLSVDIHYRIEERRLVGDHRVVADDLVLGEKVESAEGVGLPVRLAVALLKDKNGRIDLSVPIEGSVDSPEFVYRKVVWQAVKRILASIATAPFRAIGKMFGRDEEDLELVEFDPGRSDLLPAEQDKLVKIAEQLGPRAELRLEIEGRFDPLSDPAEMRRMKLTAEIDARRSATAESAAATGASTLETILEALYTERFGAEALEAERVRLVADPADPGAAATFYEALRSGLLEAQVVTDAELAALAAARATAIAGALTASGALDPSRVATLDPAPVKRKKAGSERIASEMIMSAE